MNASTKGKFGEVVYLSIEWKSVQCGALVALVQPVKKALLTPGLFVLAVPASFSASYARRACVY